MTLKAHYIAWLNFAYHNFDYYLDYELTLLKIELLDEFEKSDEWYYALDLWREIRGERFFYINDVLTHEEILGVVDKVSYTKILTTAAFYRLKEETFNKFKRSTELVYHEAAELIKSPDIDLAWEHDTKVYVETHDLMDTVFWRNKHAFNYYVSKFLNYMVLSEYYNARPGKSVYDSRIDRYVCKFTMRYWKRSIYLSMLTRENRCAFTYTSGLFFPNYKAYVRPRAQRKKDLAILRSMKHKEKKEYKKRAKRIVWKRYIKSKASVAYMFKYMRRVFSLANFGPIRIIVRGYHKNLRRHLREIFYGQQRAYYKVLLTNCYPTEIYFYNKFEHTLTERAVKKRVKKRITNKNNRKKRVYRKYIARQFKVKAGIITKADYAYIRGVGAKNILKAEDKHLRYTNLKLRRHNIQKKRVRNVKRRRRRFEWARRKAWGWYLRSIDRQRTEYRWRFIRRRLRPRIVARWWYTPRPGNYWGYRDFLKEFLLRKPFSSKTDKNSTTPKTIKERVTAVLETRPLELVKRIDRFIALEVLDMEFDEKAWYYDKVAVEEFYKKNIPVQEGLPFYRQDIEAVVRGYIKLAVNYPVVLYCLSCFYVAFCIFIGACAMFAWVHGIFI